MKDKIILLIGSLIILSILFSACTRGGSEYSIYDTSTGKRISINRMATKLAEFDVIIFGEYHDNDVIHRLQAELLPLLLKNVNDLAISMEMFERDVQIYLNQYLEGIIEEDEFVEKSRAWPNYPTDYRDIIEFAREEKIPVIAANVPRRYAAEVNRYGLRVINEITDVERVYLAEEVIITEDSYKEKFFDTMKTLSHMDIGNRDELEDQLNNLYAAQSLKDDTMAESIVNLKQRVSEAKIIHFVGDFHSRERLGLVTKIKERNPDLKIGTISPYMTDIDTRFRFRDDFSNIADFLIVLPVAEIEYYKE
jgi:uncharacterized iron-regulated protein